MGDSVWSSLLSNFGMSPDRAPSPLPACPEIPPGLCGRISLNLAVLPLDQVAAKLPRLGHGGEGKPTNCSSNHEVAVIVPYRNRPDQIAVFLKTSIPCSSSSSFTIASTWSTRPTQTHSTEP